MDFPKPIMTITELALMGFSPKNLRAIYHKRGFPVAFKESNTNTSPIKFNTAELGKYLKQLNERRV